MAVNPPAPKHSLPDGLITTPLRGHDLHAPVSLSHPFLRPPSRDDELGRLGPYRVKRLLGQGGMALVFQAEDIALERSVALKVMRPELAGPDSMQRFLREARVMASLKHDHLVTIYQAGQENGVAYFAMELLEGETLHQWLKRNPQADLAEVLRIARALTEGLAFLHQRGLVHRDIKPANIWLEGPERQVKILDLGLIRTVNEGPRLTEVGMCIGTPGFMSPEQARDEPVDARTDLFSLGCVLYCLCTGREPFPGSTTTAVLASLISETPRPIQELNPHVPAALVGLVNRLLNKDPNRRPASAEEVRDELAGISVSGSSPLPKAAGRTGKMVRPTVTRKHARKKNTLAARGITRPVLLAATALSLVMVLTLSGIAWAVLQHTDDPVPHTTPASANLLELPRMDARNYPHYPPQPPGNPQPGEVRVGGITYPNGIFMHGVERPGDEASLSFRLGKQYKTFQCDVSLNDGPRFCLSPLIFRVYGDNRILCESTPVRSQFDWQTLTVDVEGVDVLRIAVICDGPARGAHAVWINPVVRR